MKRKNLFTSQVINSVTKFDSYKEVCNHSITSSFVYIFILILLYSIATTIGVVHKTKVSFENARNFVQAEIQDFSYEDGVLNVNNGEFKMIRYNDIIIHTSDDAKLEEYGGRIVFGKTDFYINSGDTKAKFSYKNFLDGKMDKNTLLEILDVGKLMPLMICVAFVVTFIVLTISTLLDVLIIALIGLMITVFNGNNKVKFKNAFNLSVHAITLSILLGMIYIVVNAYTGFNVKYFSTMYTLIAAIYMITAVILVNTDQNAK